MEGGGEGGGETDFHTVVGPSKLCVGSFCGVVSSNSSRTLCACLPASPLGGGEGWDWGVEGEEPARGGI